MREVIAGELYSLLVAILLRGQGKTRIQFVEGKE